MRFVLAATAFVLLVSGASAQVYVWRDRGSNTIQMSSVAPNAYFDPNGPRVQLFIRDRLIDDTKARERNPTVFREVERPATQHPKNRVIYVLTQEPEMALAREKTIGDGLIENRGAWARELKNEADRQQFRDDVREAAKEAARSAIRECRNGFC